MTPTVSVVIPVRDAEASIAACLASVLAAEVPAGGLEVIVADNGSTDGTARIVRSFPVRLLPAGDRPGSYRARNVAASAASGRVIAFTDADCEVDRRWLTAALPRLEEPGVGVVAGRIEAAAASTGPARYQTRTGALDQERALRHAPLPYAQTANCVVRREAFDAVGGFDPGFLSGGDADFCWRLQMHTPWRIVYEPSCRVFHHHRATWRGVFRQTLGHTRGMMALERKHREWYVARDVPSRFGRGRLSCVLRAAASLGAHGAAVLGALLKARPEGLGDCYGDLVRAAAFHAACCSGKGRIA